jgi:hypothetical protein
MSRPAVLVSALALLLLSDPVLAQTAPEPQPYAALKDRMVKALSEQQVADCAPGAAWALRCPPS